MVGIEQVVVSNHVLQFALPIFVFLLQFLDIFIVLALLPNHFTSALSNGCILVFVFKTQVVPKTAFGVAHVLFSEKDGFDVHHHWIGRLHGSFRYLFRLLNSFAVEITYKLLRVALLIGVCGFIAVFCEVDH
jgi:hypothetical protein